MYFTIEHCATAKNGLVQQSNLIFSTAAKKKENKKIFELWWRHWCASRIFYIFILSDVLLQNLKVEVKS